MKNHTLIFLALLSHLQGTIHKGQANCLDSSASLLTRIVSPEDVGSDIGCCGSENFNKTSQLCCGPNKKEKVVTKLTSADVCCGDDKTYVPACQCCCINESGKSEVTSRALGGKCCDDDHQPDTGKDKQIICENHTHPHNDPNIEYCDNVTFNKTSQLCCGPTGNKTVLAKTTKEEVCCGDKTYYPAHQCCFIDQSGRSQVTSCCPRCDQDHQPNSSTMIEGQDKCCKSSDLSHETRICFGNSINPHDPDIGCCGNEIFNKTSQLCCGPSEEEKVVTKFTPTDVCCGADKTYVPDCQCCCVEPGKSWVTSQQLGGKCDNVCLSGELQKDLQIVCGSHIHPHNFSDFECCGNGIYNTTSQLCCGPEGNKKVVTKATQADVCCGADKSYFKAHQCCCFDQSELKSQVTSRALGGECCDNDSLPETIAFCGLEEYNASTHICCTGKLFPKPEDGERKCCGRVVYNPIKEHCCDGVLWKAVDCSAGWPEAPSQSLSQTSMCGSCSHPSRHYCGWDQYDPIRQICCQGHSHIRNRPELSCCGNEIYNPWKDKPCLGRLHCSQGFSLDSMAARHTEKHRGETKVPPRYHRRAHNRSAGLKMQPLTTWRKKDICCSHVFLGWVESVVQDKELTVIMTAILRINGTRVTAEAQPRPLHIPLHGNNLHLQRGTAYLWTEKCPRLLISDITDLIAPVYTLLSRQQRLRCD